MNETLAWTSLILGFLLGIFGTLIPGLPGSVFVVLGVLVFKYLLPAIFGWWVVVAIAVLAVVSWIVDLLSGAMGAKLGGASRWGLIGAGIGGFVGVFFGPVGWLLGPFLGAIIGDLYAKRREIAALIRSGLGAFFGFILSLVARFILLIAMAVVVLAGLMS